MALLLALIACGADTETVDSSTTDTLTDTGPVYDNSYCEEEVHDAPQQACCDYVAAYNACAETYGSQDWKDGETTGCELAGDDQTTRWQCLADLFTDADCTTSDGWNQAIQDATGC